MTAGFVDYSRRLPLLVLAATVLLLPPTLPLAQVSLAFVYRNQQLPILFRPDAIGAHYFYNLQNASGRVIEVPELDTAVLMIKLGPGPWPGVTIHDLWSNWTPYQVLGLEMYNPGSDVLDINIRIDDAVHRDNQLYSDRYNSAWQIAPGLQTIEIPLADIAAGPADRQMDLTEVERIIIFSDDSAQNRSFGMKSIKLSQSARARH